MALGFTPAVEIYGTNAALLNERLLEWEHTDAAGFVSDQLKLTLDIEGLEGLPSLGGRIGLRVGYLETGLEDKGLFKITQRTPYLFPLRLVLVATARRSTRTNSNSAAQPAMGQPPWAHCSAN